MAEQQIQTNNLVQLNKGLHTDNSHLDSPRGTYRFALNSVNETELGDSGFISNEESNIECDSLTPGYIPIGKCYIGNNNTVIFSVSSDNTISEIGILDDDCNYVVHVNDYTSVGKDKLGFKLEHQIQATYRLRRGCERTVYFTDGNTQPKYYNFDKPEQFKRGTTWSAPKFNLYKSLEKFPTLDSVKVIDSFGNLTPGSYTILVQHLDEDLNGTEFYELIRDINIYNDALTKSFTDIDGSGNIGNTDSPYKYDKTNKAIEIKLDSVDTNFSYIRFAFVERTSGNGQVSSVKYSEPLSVYSPMFTYTGDNASTIGTIEEVELFNANAGIKTAKHIEQIDNMLILANVSGDQTKMCKLQKYASKIKTDCYVKDIILTSIKEDHNPKNPLVVHNGLGYQPGEIYSLGIVYLFEDYTTSPVFHIPGKSPDVSKTFKYSTGPNIYPMSNTNNQNSSEIYLDENTSCSGEDYWGLDAEGTHLKNKNIRHHRFPTRDEIGIDFVKQQEFNSDIVKFKRITLTLSGDIKKTITCDGTDPDCVPYAAKIFKLTVKYKKNGIDEEFHDFVYPDSSVLNNLIQSNLFLNNDNITDIKLFYQEEDTTEIEIILDSTGKSDVQDNNLTYRVNLGNIEDNNSSAVYTAPILGLKFIGIELPSEEEIGKKVIGYQIVRQERREIDRTILDSAVVLPMIKSNKNISTGMIAPEYQDCEVDSYDGGYNLCYPISKKNVQLITPLHKFMNKTFDGFTSIEEVGKFKIQKVTKTACGIGNVYDGTSATGDETRKTRDDDGFTLREAIRFTGVDYFKSDTNKFNTDNQDVRMYNLEGVNYSDNETGDETLYNLACDNKALVLSSTHTGIDLRTYRPGHKEFPYVYIKKDSLSFYQNFRSNPYYIIDTRVFEEDNCQVFGGDTYIAPLRYSNHIFGNVAVAKRVKKLNAWQIIASIVVAIVGAALAIFSGGSSLLIAGGIITAIGAIAMGAATIIEVAKFNEIYGDKWEANLDRTVMDWFYCQMFIREYPNEDTGAGGDQYYLQWRDDTFRWFGDIIGDLWFETPINIFLRVPPKNMENNYLKPLKSYMNDRPDKVNTYVHSVGFNGNGGGFLGIGSGDNYHYYHDIVLAPELPEEWFFTRKICNPDNSRGSGYIYTGMSIPQVYLCNPDHNVSIGVKKFYTIPLEYDCCSDCVEKFPHRLHYSQQSFQEEKSDNYRLFLPNNYRDIEGETGEITNIFRLYNNLFAHTKEALWQMGRNYQERVTDNVVSFIGTGSYFEIPPQKIIDDDTGSSAGTQHKWSAIKTPVGYFFVSENQRKIYQFDGKQMKPISNLGISNWFKNNIEVDLDKEYYKIKGVQYPNKDNPSNPFGTGFISTYDSRKERIIFTKRDLKFSEQAYTPGTEVCTNGNSVTLFPNINQTIQAELNDGWTYAGIDNCRLKFFKDVVKTRTEIRLEEQSIFKDVDYLVFRYNFTNQDGRDLDTRTQLLQPFQSETLGWCQNHVNTPYIGWASDNTGYGIEAILINIKKFKEDYPNVNEIVFNSKAWWYGERLSGNMNMNAEGYKGGTMTLDTGTHNFINSGGVLQGTYSFQTINIPQGGQSSCNPNPTNIGNFTYKIDNGELSWDGVSGGEIPVETITVEVEVTVNYIEREYKYLDGITIPLSEFIENNNSWTISYSLKNESWISWHSYIPNMYINVPERFYSWKYGNNNIWLHNIIGKYQSYYNTRYPHIIEYVSISNPVVTRIWNSIMLQTEAKTYDKDLQQYIDERYITFNKAILYNSRQCSGEMDLIVKDIELYDLNYLENQVKNNTSLNTSIIDRTEKDWYINDFRDIRVDYTKPIWRSDIHSLQNEYFIDKILNTDTLDVNKDWTQLESFRDKYLVIRLIFDKFADKKLITNFSVENEQPSFY